jgi:hypothetical protein
MRESGEITAREFAERKNRHQTEITTLEDETTQEALRTHANKRALASAFRFLAESRDLAMSPSAEAKRQLASLLAEEYILTRGKLQIRPNSVLLKLRAFEPPSDGDLQSGGGQNGLANPIVRAWWDQVRTVHC